MRAQFWYYQDTVGNTQVIVILATANLVQVQPYLLLLTLINTCATCRQWSIGPIWSIGVHPAASTLNDRVLAGPFLPGADAAVVRWWFLH